MAVCAFSQGASTATHLDYKGVFTATSRFYGERRTTTPEQTAQDRSALRGRADNGDRWFHHVQQYANMTGASAGAARGAPSTPVRSP